MTAFVRSIYELLLKRESMAGQYFRKHPRRIGMLSIDAILVMVLVSVGFSYASAPSKAETSLILMRVGGVALSSAEFVEYTRSNLGSTYWLGDISGFEIVQDDRIDARRSISYVKKGSDRQDLNRSKITIVTYHTPTNYNGLREFGTWSAPFTTITSSGLMVEYDLNSMMGAIISMNGTPHSVYIKYPKAQELQVLLANADALRLVA